MTFRPPHFRATQSAFTLVEIAISLAIIGIALVGIIGVLPLGLNVQRDNREDTIINQDASVFLDAISHGARGLDDLTNYVYAITNTVTKFVGGVAQSPPAYYGYTYTNSTLNGSLTSPLYPIDNGTNIIGLLSTPQFTDNFGNPINNLFGNGYSNHVYAYVRSLSGAAVEKPPQNNDIIQQDAFGYRLLCVNAAVSVSAPSVWQSQSYNAGSEVYYNSSWWQATANTVAGDIPGTSPLWTQDFYDKHLDTNLHELRLTFFWPTLPNGGVGGGRQSYRTTIGGQILQVALPAQTFYFYQSQSFTNSP